jgi:hypothetical protein
MTFMFYPLGKNVSISNEWEDGHVSGTLDSLRKQTLMSRADSTDSPGQYLSSFGNKVAEEFTVFEVDIGDFFSAKFAYPLATDAESFWTWHSSWPFYDEGPDDDIRSPMKTLQT